LQGYNYFIAIVELHIDLSKVYVYMALNTLQMLLQ